MTTLTTTTSRRALIARANAATAPHRAAYTTALRLAARSLVSGDAEIGAYWTEHAATIRDRAAAITAAIMTGAA